MSDEQQRDVATVGHGALASLTFAGLLLDAGVTEVVDIRAQPGSRRHPQFGRTRLAEWLPERGLVYSWEPRLGGRRHALAVSAHVALSEEALRAYADHMATPAFAEALDDLLARPGRVAVMCAEGDWRQCHRHLLADALVSLRRVTVTHLAHDGSRQGHALATSARLADGRLVYDVGATARLF